MEGMEFVWIQKVRIAGVIIVGQEKFVQVVRKNVVPPIIHKLVAVNVVSLFLLEVVSMALAFPMEENIVPAHLIITA